jgi:hypothetical protein
MAKHRSVWLALIGFIVALAPARVMATDFLISSTRVVVKPGKVMKFVAKGAFPAWTANPVVNGGSITVIGQTGSATYNLAPGIPPWKATLRSARYNDGVCRFVMRFLQPGQPAPKLLKGICKPNTGTLAENEPGPVSIIVTFNNSPSGQDRYCAECGGAEVLSETPFRARGCSSPVACGCAAGKETGGACWFQGQHGESCDTVCGNAGLVYSETTRTFAGSDGTNAGCSDVIDLFPSVPTYVQNDCGSYLGLPEAGYGCWQQSSAANRFRCAALATTSSAANADVRRYCACK